VHLDSGEFSPSPPKIVTPCIRTLDTLPAPPSSPSTSRETSPKSSIYTDEIEEEDLEEGDVIETDVQQFGTKHFGELASPYVTPYLYKKAYLDREFGIRKDADGQFRIGNSKIKIEEDINVVLQGDGYERSIRIVNT
jgi:hypothetical protein